MYRFSAFAQACCFVLSIFATSSLLHAQHHVFYLSAGSSITTYNVDPTTGTPTQVGTLTISGAQFISNIVPAPNDHFIYVYWTNANSKNTLSVYDTNTSGVPQSTPVQTLSASGLGPLFIHKSGKYAYVIHTTSGQNGYSETLYLYHVNQTTGVLTRDSKIQATYGPDYYYQESLVSFNKAGTRLYDVWSVSFDHENNYYYSYHPIAETTGQLSPDVGTYFYASNYDGLDEQYFTTHYILNLHGDGGYTNTQLNVFPNKKNPQQPTFTCTVSMLDACGNYYRYWISADEQYVLIGDNNTNETVIGRIEGSSKQIAQTGSISGLPTLYISPDNQLIYAADSFGSSVQVYVFNAANGTATSGGSVTFNSSNGYGIFPALRQ